MSISPHASPQAAYEAQIGRWPRRLLHVPTMTSYCWRPGNVYGNTSRPDYNAITYTWGRWMLRGPEEQPAVTAMDVKGVDWQVPRIDPKHFTRDEFLAVTQRATGRVPRTAAEIPRDRHWFPEGHQLPEHRETEWLWVDIACIDQRSGSPDSAAEVGRQAEIFRNAKNVFFWVTTFTGRELDVVLKALSGLDSLDTAQHAQPPSDIRHALERLSADPWFSSLWTLQEAFLRPDAMLISRDGQSSTDLWASESPDWRDFSFSLSTLAYNCGAFLGFIEDLVQLHDEMGTVQEERDRVYALISRIGILEIADANPLNTFTVSGARTTKREEDRVYAIQQIFGFRLGATAPDPPRRSFTREDLEAAFSCELLARVPIASQIHVHAVPVAFGDAWQFRPTCRLARSSPVPKWSVSPC